MVDRAGGGDGGSTDVTEASWSLASELWQMRSQGRHVDLRLVAASDDRALASGESAVEAHRVVLAATWPQWWRTLLEENADFKDGDALVILPGLERGDILHSLERTYLQGEPFLRDLFPNDIGEGRTVSVTAQEQGEEKAISQASEDAAPKRSKPSKSSSLGGGGGPVKCDRCEKTLSSLKQLRTHALVHFPERWNFGCEACGERFITARALAVHKARRHGDTLPCSACPKRFSSDSNLRTHLATVHGLLASGEKAPPSEQAAPCEFCGQVFRSRAYLAKHVLRHRKEGADFETKKCPTCGKMLKGRYYYQHVQMHRPSTWKYRCRFCDKRFQGKYKMLDHEATVHTGESPFACDACGDKFQSTTKKSKHRKICPVLHPKKPPDPDPPGDVNPSTTSKQPKSSDQLPLVLPHIEQRDGVGRVQQESEYLLQREDGQDLILRQARILPGGRHLLELCQVAASRHQESGEEETLQVYQLVQQEQQPTAETSRQNTL